jgi:ribosomal protein S18 acetylase RimI-like enzyme
MIATRTYLELTDPKAFRPRRTSEPGVQIARRDDCPPELLTYLYAEVGRDYRWVDRLPWTDEQTRAYLTDPAVSVWLLTIGTTLAGYFELRRDAANNTSMEIAYFGLLPGFTGRGLGAHMLTAAVESAWAAGARRVWLHTCTFDHPGAIANYQARGFSIFKSEEYVVP